MNKNNQGYTTSMIILLLIIPCMILLLLVIDETEHINQNTQKNIKSDKLSTNTDEFIKQLPTQAHKMLNNITLNVTTSKKPLKNATKTMKEVLQSNINNLSSMYKNINITCKVLDIKKNSNPFKIDIYYSLNSTDNTDKILKKFKQTIKIDDNPTNPVYDPELHLKAHTIKQKNIIRFKNNPNLTTTYEDAYAGDIIRECSLINYTHHGNSNMSIQNCIDNHYYHTSRDGLCLFCRLENKTSCKDMGFETFIIPQHKTDKAIVSTDHVLLNDTNQYQAGYVEVNESTILYLDNGHRTKYGL